MAVMAVVVVVGTDRIWEGIVCRCRPRVALLHGLGGVERSQRTRVQRCLLRHCGSIT